MKAVRAVGPGEAKVMGVEAPETGSGDVLIRVRSAAVNPIDVAVWRGRMKPIDYPLTLGGDFAGIVERVSPDVSRFNLGDEVYGYAPIFGGGSGSFAEYLRASSKVVGPKPKSLDFRSSAAAALVGICAWDSLVNKIGLKAGQKIRVIRGVR